MITGTAPLCYPLRTFVFGYGSGIIRYAQNHGQDSWGK